MRWDAMTGDERRRFCDSCKLHVYNLSDMSALEAEAFVRSAEGIPERTCIRFHVRADGTILTKDCPVGLAALRRRLATVAASVAAAIGLVIGGLVGTRHGWAGRSWFRSSGREVAGAMIVAPPRPQPPTPSSNGSGR